MKKIKRILEVILILTVFLLATSCYYLYNNNITLNQNNSALNSLNDSIKNSNGVLILKITDLGKELDAAKKAKINIKKIKSVNEIDEKIQYDTIIKYGESLIIYDSIYGKKIQYTDKCFKVTSSFNDEYYTLNIQGTDTIWGYRYDGKKIGKWKLKNLIIPRKRMDTYSVYNTNPCIKINFTGFIDDVKNKK